MSEPRKRPDRAAKFAARKTLKETVVKGCLHKYVGIENPEQKQAFLDGVNELVTLCSKRTVRASIALNMLARKAFDGQEDVTKVVLPELWDQTFIRQLMLGTEDALKPYKEITSLFKEYPTLLHPTDQRSLTDRNVYTAAAKKLSTNVKNHLVLNYQKAIKHIVYAFPGTKEHSIAMLYKINGWNEKNRTFPQLSEAMQQEISTVRNILKLSGDAKADKVWLKKPETLYSLIRLFVYSNRFLEREDLSLFNILPICRVKAHFITIDTTTLHGLMMRADMISKDCSLKVFNELGKAHWESILRINKLVGKGKEFTGTIETDGVAVNVHFQRPKNRVDIFQEEAPQLFDENLNVVGVDPGRTNILYMVRKAEDGSFRSMKLTRSEYYQQAGILQARKQTEHWSRTIRPSLVKLSNASPKGVCLKTFLTYWDVFQETEASLWTEYLKRRWAAQRLRLYGGKKRVFANFLNRVEASCPKDKKTVMAFGSAKFAPGGKGEVSVPTSRAFKECSYRFPTISVDEFRTSRVFHGDLSTLLDCVGTKDTNNKKETRLRGLLWCCSTNITKNKPHPGLFVNRDLNAAINIRQCALLPKRPPMLDRSKTKEALPKQQIRRWIHC
jgi:hypothetical protein